MTRRWPPASPLDRRNTTVSFRAQATDVDDPTTWSVSQRHSTDYGHVTFGGQTLTYEPFPFFTGTESFTYTVTDGDAEGSATYSDGYAACQQHAPRGWTPALDRNGGNVCSRWRSRQRLEDDTRGGDGLLAVLDQAPEHGTLVLHERHIHLHV